jgi:hypothetical protein
MIYYVDIDETICSYPEERAYEKAIPIVENINIINALYSDNDDILLAKECILGPGDNFHVYTGLRHQMIALEDTELFEFSTQHFDSDSHRLIKGD